MIRIVLLFPSGRGFVILMGIVLVVLFADVIFIMSVGVLTDATVVDSLGVIFSVP